MILLWLITGHFPRDQPVINLVKDHGNFMKIYPYGTFVRRYVRAIVGIATAALMVGCQDQLDGPTLKSIPKSELDTALKQQPDAWRAFLKLDDLLRRVNTEQPRECYDGDPEKVIKGCENALTPQMVQTKQAVLFKIALSEQRPEAMTMLYSWDDSYGRSPDFLADGELKKLKESLLPVLSNMVEKAGLTKQDADLLAMAGNVYAEGKITTRDTQRAIELYARSWASGNVGAARMAADSYFALKDYPSAYIWMLRCVKECQRDEGLLGSIQDQLSPNVIIHLQQAANDSTVIKGNTDE